VIEDGAAPATVLVVDDRAAKRYLLVSWLRRAGYQIIEAETGGQALQRLDEAAVDLVVLDVRLPDISGYEVCRQIKADARYSAIPVIHVSAHAVDLIDRTRGLEGGADAYLSEPIEPEELIATSRAVLRYYRARRQAEFLADRLTRMADATLSINSTTTLRQLLATAAGETASLFGSPALVIASTDDHCYASAVVGAGKQTVTSVVAAPAGMRPVGAEITVGAAGDWPAWPGQPDDQVAVAVARLRSDRHPVYIVVPQAAQRPATGMLLQFVQALSAAVHTQRTLDQEHRVAVTLQRSLLPQRLPAIPNLDIAVRYEPGSPHTEVGGDFYEVSLIGDKLLVAIGDVAGHSLHAATVMAEVRHAIRAYAVEGHQPGTVLDLVNRVLATLLPGETATVCLLVLDPASGVVTMCSAGHLPPLLVSAGVAEFLTHHTPLLGLRTPPRRNVEFTLPVGGTLLLYTDGLIERRDVDIDDRLAELSQAATRVDADLDGYCDRLVTELSGPLVNDDIAVLALRRTR
jgi:DNA-binding response OmpR family regulator